MQDVSRIPIRLKIVTGTYILQTHRAKYSNDTAVSPLGTDHLTCKGGMVFRFVQNFFFGRHESQNIYFFVAQSAKFFRERPFNLKGGGGYGFFSKKKCSDSQCC